MNDYKSIENTNDIEVKNIEVKQTTQKRPYPINTVSMLKMASEQLHMSPQQTMHVAEKLYLSGYTTYPRTETNKYPKSFDIYKVLRDVQGGQHKD